MTVRNFLRRIASILALVFACAGAAFGQAPSPSWVLMNGSAVDLAVDAGGDAFAVSADGLLWRWRHDSGGWGRMSGALSRVAAGSGGKPWGLAPDGTVMRYNGLWWEVLEKRAQDIALDLANNAYVVLRDGSLARYNSLRGDWESLPGSGRRRIAVTADGLPWTVGEDGAVARWDGRQWQALPGKARDIGIGGDGAAFIVGDDGRLFRWDGGTWNPVEGPTDLAAIAVAPGGMPWVANSRGAIYAYSLPAPPPAAKREAPSVVPPSAVSKLGAKRAEQRAAAAAVVASPARRTDPATIEFQDTKATGMTIAIGLDGSVFALMADGQLYRWNNGQMRLLSFPGQFVKIAVDPAGNPWGINLFGRIFRHDGADWRQARGTASDISISANGTVLVADANGVLGRYDAAANGFVRIDGSAVFVAAAPDGMPWGLLADGTAVRCRGVPCERLGKQGRSLSIGPDGSAFLVGLDNRLYRYNAARGEWEFIVVPNHTPTTVAVGPSGRPWLVTTQQKLLASTYFPRDESLDRQVATATQGSTTGSGDAATVVSSTATTGGFVFAKSLSVKTYSFPHLGSLNGVKVGPDGTVLGIDLEDGQIALYKFDTKSKTFVPTLKPPEVYTTAVTGPDGMIWALSASFDGRVYKQKNATTYERLDLPNPACTSCMADNRDLAVGSDGTVYMIDTTGTVWRRPANSTTFSKFLQGTYSKVAVGRAGDVWVLDNNYYVRQVVNGKAELRPAGKQTEAYDIGAGPDGSVWISVRNGFSYAARWNATNQSFDLTNKNAVNIDVAPDGRPWFTDGSSNDVFAGQ